MGGGGRVVSRREETMITKKHFKAQMKATRCVKQPSCKTRSAAFTLVEMLVAMAVIGAVVGALYGAITSAFSSIRLARENLRATQILLEKMEGFRLYDWDQITSAAYIPRTFLVPYDPAGSTNSGVVYSGQVTIAPVSLTASYANDLRLVTVQLNWTSGSLPRQRQLSTYLCRTGIQNYFY